MSKYLIIQNEIQNRIEQLRKELSLDDNEIEEVIIALNASLTHYQQMQLMRFSYDEYFKSKEAEEKPKGTKEFLEFVKNNNMGVDLEETEIKEE